MNRASASKNANFAAASAPPSQHTSPRTTLVFWNPNSGRAEQALALGQQLRARADVHVVETEASAEMRKSLVHAVHEGCKLVIAAGGDGTVNAVVNAMLGLAAEERPPMAVLPIGTANDFAFTLQLPDSLDAAWEWLFTGPYTPVDVVRMTTGDGARYFVNVAAGGNSVRVTDELTDELKQRWGALCYLRGAIGVLSDLTAFHCAVQFDDEPPQAMDVWSLLVANGKTNAGRMLVAPEASPSDGLMDVILVRDGGLIDLASIATSFALGNYLQCDQVVHRKVRSLALESAPPMRFSLDGEVVDDEPVRFDIVPGALQMRAGGTFER